MAAAAANAVLYVDSACLKQLFPNLPLETSVKLAPLIFCDCVYILLLLLRRGASAVSQLCGFSET